MTLPAAEVALVRISSALVDGALSKLGVWQWLGAPDPGPLATLANEGQVWLLSPFQVLRMVHAVRLPLVAAALGSPVASRTPGSLSVDLDDPEFQVDAKSTSHIDMVAAWTDPYDNPSDPTSDPGEPPPGTSTKRSTISSGGPAFRLTIPDPTPTGPEAQPLTVVQPEQAFAFSPNEDNNSHQESATHHIGDTLHHLVYYTATGTSRFADLFETSETTTITAGTPLTLGTAAAGVERALGQDHHRLRNTAERRGLHRRRVGPHGDPDRHRRPPHRHHLHRRHQLPTDGDRDRRGEGRRGPRPRRVPKHRWCPRWYRPGSWKGRRVRSARAASR